MRNLWARYVAGDPALVPLCPWPWPEVPWDAVLARKALSPIDRKPLVEALLAQNTALAAEDPALRRAIEKLADPTTFTVTTGQQLGWLTGPLYTVIKAIHALQLARDLEAIFAGRYQFVPVFWLASEDHDAAEVVQAEIGWGKVLQYGGRFMGPVGRHRIEAAFPREAQALALQTYWVPGRSWEEAFREAMQALFRGTGLVWLSGDDPVLKARAAPLWQREVQHKLTFAAHQLATSYLQKLHIQPRLHARAINLFWLSDTERRYPTPEEEALLREAAYTAPERLSPNVLLRPLYQEYLLPNAAYVAGPAEVAYWLELTPVFSAFGIEMPVVYPRGHLRVLFPGAPPLPEGITWKEVWSFSQSRLKTLLTQLYEPHLWTEIHAWWAKHRPPWEELCEKPFLGQAARALERFWQKWYETLARATHKTAYAKHRAHIEQILAYRRQVEPEGTFQERRLNIHTFSPENPTSWVYRWLSTLRLRPAEWIIDTYPIEG